MIVNKRALYALAAYYENLPHQQTNGFKNETYVPNTERKHLYLDLYMCTAGVSDVTLKSNILHMEIYFKFDLEYPSCCDDPPYYRQKLNVHCIAKFLRYLGKHSKFPKVKSLHYV